MILFVIFVALVAVVLGLAAACWGGDHRQGLDSEDGQRQAALTFPSHRA